MQQPLIDIERERDELKLKVCTANYPKGLDRYCKVPKFSDARKLCCNLLKTQTKSPNRTFFYRRVFLLKDAT